MSPLEKLVELARRRDLHTLLLREPATLGWLLGGRVHVPQTLDTACLDVIASGLSGPEPRLMVVSNAIEAPRLAETEFALAPGPLDQQAVPWWGDRTACFPTGPGVGADRPWGDAVDVSADLAAARRVLDDDQAARLAGVTADTAAAVGRVARELRPGLTEYEVAGRMAASLLTSELDPVVLMVAADGRDRRHRHPLPTGRRGESSFLLVCCGRRHGLVASVTRQVLFRGTGPDPGERADRQHALLRVERAFLDASTPGTRLGDVVAEGTAAYAGQGFASDEWTRHHQGGLSGWLPREFPAHVGSDLNLTTGMVVAWNPSGDGVKVEDTCLVTSDGVRPLGRDPEWPTVEVGGRLRPDLLWR